MKKTCSPLNEDNGNFHQSVEHAFLSTPSDFLALECSHLSPIKPHKALYLMLLGNKAARFVELLLESLLKLHSQKIMGFIRTKALKVLQLQLQAEQRDVNKIYVTWNVLAKFHNKFIERVTHLMNLVQL